MADYQRKREIPELDPSAPSAAREATYKRMDWDNSYNLWHDPSQGKPFLSCLFGASSLPANEYWRHFTCLRSTGPSAIFANFKM